MDRLLPSLAGARWSFAGRRFKGVAPTGRQCGQDLPPVLPSSLTTAQSAIAQLQTSEKETALQMQNDEKENEKQRVEIPPISRTWIRP